MAQIFVSYSRKDISFAKKLIDSFDTDKLKAWIDWEDIPPSVDWWAQIQKGIEEADTYLFLISPDSAASKVCAQELDCAVKNGKRLIPLVVREIPADEAPAQIGRFNWIFFRESDDFDAAIQKLITGSLDRTARLWELQTGKLLRTLKHSDYVNAAVFSNDGKYILTGSDDGQARIWDTDYHDTLKYTCSLLFRQLSAEEIKTYEILDPVKTCP